MISLFLRLTHLSIELFFLVGLFLGLLFAATVESRGR